MKRFLLYSVLLFTAVKLVAVFFFVSDVRLWEDYEMAKQLFYSGELKYFHNGQWNYNYNFPVYPFVSQVFFLIGGVNAKSMLVLNVLLHSASVWIFFNWIGIFFSGFSNSRFADRYKEKIAFYASLVFLFHPLINYYGIMNAHPFAMNQFFIVISLYLGWKFIDQTNIKNGLLYASVLGIGFIDRSTLVVCTLPVVILAIKKFGFFKGVGKMSLVAMIALLPVAFWLMRNYSIQPQLALTSSLGENMWLGVLEESEGTTTMKNGETYYAALGQYKDTIPKLNFAEQNAFYMDLYRKKINEQPGLLMKMFFVKWFNFWFFRSGIGNDYSALIRKFIPIYIVVYLFAMVLAIVGSLFLGRKALLVWSFLVALSVLQAWVYVETRHRIIIEPYLFFLAVVGIAAIIYRLKKTELS